MELALHLDNTNVITGMFCLLGGSLQGWSTAQGLLHKIRHYSGAEALPNLATSLPANYVDGNTQDYNGRAEGLRK